MLWHVAARSRSLRDSSAYKAIASPGIYHLADNLSYATTKPADRETAILVLLPRLKGAKGREDRQDFLVIHGRDDGVVHGVVAP
jgi:hypothetical protein